MKINQLWLMNFRNYENTVIDFAESNLLVGLNGAGKTNILEAIDILATSRSKIVKGLNKCIRRGQVGFAISGKFKAIPPSAEPTPPFSKGGESPLPKGDAAIAAGGFTVAFRQERSTDRKIKINDETLQRASDLIGKVNSVIFLPSDLEIIHGQPSLRRKYLDIIISQAETEYYRSLQIYTRALKQRNELLKSLQHGVATSPDTLTAWDKQLAESGACIMLKRREYLEFFARETGLLYKAMGFVGDLSIRYKTETLADTAANLQALTGSRADDIRFGRTHFGPHADDFEFYLNDSKASEFCSQGQRRLIAVAFKCAEAKIKADKLQDPPVVLVDDVLLELDLERLNKIITAIAPGSQKIFTVTDTGRFSAEILREMKIIKIDNGRVV
ncbi:DNA recombination protein RecF [Candidatus Termititenax dinenymphae]|uniref:DNA replication and repair protein RecF n=1 Tax=Candidatus Termititenax dinenymphae TaxID=2218523 RepID=A0A388TJE7_9BACT|nr:DNA recombination protein RecF [Candidatus Termititenax dinenymphae]